MKESFSQFYKDKEMQKLHNLELGSEGLGLEFLSASNSKVHLLTKAAEDISRRTQGHVLLCSKEYTSNLTLISKSTMTVQSPLNRICS